MPTIENQDPADALQAGVTLKVSGAASENEAILAVENYLREKNKENLELSVTEKSGEDTYQIRLD